MKSAIAATAAFETPCEKPQLLSERLNYYKKKLATAVGLIHKRCVQSFHLLLTLNIYLKSIHVFRLPNIRCINRHRHMIALKYLGKYLAGSFDYKCRGSILLYHYSFINYHMSKYFMETITKGQIVLWTTMVGSNIYTMSIDFHNFDNQGDLAVIFNMNGMEIYIAAFTFIKGITVSIDSDQVILVARVQGTKGTIDLIRQATKDLNDISPSAILVTSIQAIATALKIDNIAGITANEQIDKYYMHTDKIFFNYDKLWISMGGDKVNEQVFRLPTKPHNKSIIMVKRNHRSRAKNKRQFKCHIYNEVIQSFQDNCL